MNPSRPALLAPAFLLALSCTAPAAEDAPEADTPSTLSLDLGGGVTVELARVPAGTFVMGAPEDEAAEYKEKIKENIRSHFNEEDAETAYHTGDVLEPGQANHAGSHKGQTTLVGSYPLNAWGLHDMHGNVYEWCAGWLAPYPEGPAVDPKGPVEGSAQILRGGAWRVDPENARSASRIRGPGIQDGLCGFRIVVD